MKHYVRVLIGEKIQFVNDLTRGVHSMGDEKSLPSIRIELSTQEMDALAEYARQCGESIPDIVRKVVVRDMTLADGYGAEDSSYDFRILLPTENSLSGDRKHLQESYNRIRRILGWKEIQF